MEGRSNLEKILIRYIRGECTTEDKRGVEELIRTNPEINEKYEELKRTWEETRNFRLERNKENSWRSVEQRIEEHEEAETPIYELNVPGKTESSLGSQPGSQQRSPSGRRKKSRRVKWGVGLAAALLLMGFVSYLLLSPRLTGMLQQANPVMEKIATQPGERVSVTFSDGTRVRLNSASTIRLPKKFDGDLREIELVEGEAYFEVITQKNRPFVVHTSRADIEVLGTKFNVNSYSHNENIEVVVAEGEVAVKGRQDSERGTSGSIRESVRLNRGQLTRVGSTGIPSRPENVTLNSYISWVDGVFTFENSSLAEVIDRLGNHYDLTFEVADSSLYKRNVTAEFRNESLSTVLDVLMFSLDIEYEKQGTHIILKPEE
ncbi:FecR family protein [Halalkalibaculum sp. DA3122]